MVYDFMFGFKRKKSRDLDSTMESLNALDEREMRQIRKNMEVSSHQGSQRNEIGEVEKYFDRINVAAIKLTDRLSVGDTVEIDDGDETLRLKISSMQIDRNDVSEASEGDSIGVKIKHRVSEGSRVYKLQ